MHDGAVSSPPRFAQCQWTVSDEGRHKIYDWSGLSCVLFIRPLKINFIMAMMNARGDECFYECNATRS